MSECTAVHTRLSFAGGTAAEGSLSRAATWPEIPSRPPLVSRASYPVPPLFTVPCGFNILDRRTDRGRLIEEAV
jgi:hypothetical protein